MDAYTHISQCSFPIFEKILYARVELGSKSYSKKILPLNIFSNIWLQRQSHALIAYTKFLCIQSPEGKAKVSNKRHVHATSDSHLPEAKIVFKTKLLPIGMFCCTLLHCKMFWRQKVPIIRTSEYLSESYWTECPLRNCDSRCNHRGLIK